MLHHHLHLLSCEKWANHYYVRVTSASWITTTTRNYYYYFIFLRTQTTHFTHVYIMWFGAISFGATSRLILDISPAFVCWKMIINQMKPLWKCESVGAEPTAMKKNEKKVILFPKKCRILYKAAAIWGNARVLFVIWSPQRQRKFSSIVPPPKFCFNCKSHNLGVGCLALFPFNFASNF